MNILLRPLKLQILKTFTNVWRHIPVNGLVHVFVNSFMCFRSFVGMWHSVRKDFSFFFFLSLFPKNLIYWDCLQRIYTKLLTDIYKEKLLLIFSFFSLLLAFQFVEFLAHSWKLVSAVLSAFSITLINILSVYIQHFTFFPHVYFQFFLYLLHFKDT